MNNDNSQNQSLWSLDPRLATDTIKVAEHSNCDVLLMNDSRWPWIIIVPHAAGAEELQDLNDEQQKSVMKLTLHLGKALKSITSCEKLNTAAIGNMVRQLHIHIVARSTGDANWPAPVWGYGRAEKYTEDQSSKLISNIQSHLPISSPN